jgi:hypothetical protein
LGEVKFKDEDGNIVKTEQSENKVKGHDGDEYTTEKNEKDGFKFVKTQDPKDNPTYSTDGKSTTGKIVGNKDQSITYVYEKVVKRKNQLHVQYVQRLSQSQSLSRNKRNYHSQVLQKKVTH